MLGQRRDRRLRGPVVKADLVRFALPGLLVLLLGLMVSSTGGYDGLTEAVWNLAWNPSSWRDQSGFQLTGLAMYIIGLTLAVVSVVTLGPNYGPTPVTREGHELVVRGPYRLVRHPIYLGILIVVMGVPVYASSVLGGLVMAGLIPIFLRRIRVEEQGLVETFGDDYREYVASTPALIPFVL